MTQKHIIVDTGNSKIQVTVLGDGETIVMIPSFGRSVQDYTDLSHRLANAGYRIVLPEPRLIGKSTGPTENLTLHDIAADMAAVIKRVVGAPVTIIGHAGGNRVARMVATDYPTLVKRIVLIACGGKEPMKPEILQALTKCFDTGISREDHLANVKLAFFADGNDPSVWDQGWYAEAAMYQSQAALRTEYEEWWEGGTALMLVFQGLEDKIAVPENAAQLKQQVGDRMTLVEVAKAGHAMLPEQPDLVYSKIVEYLKR